MGYFYESAKTAGTDKQLKEAQMNILTDLHRKFFNSKEIGGRVWVMVKVRVDKWFRQA
jgi:hypothetical protein